MKPSIASQSEACVTTWIFISIWNGEEGPVLGDLAHNLWDVALQCGKKKHTLELVSESYKNMHNSAKAIKKMYFNRQNINVFGV